MKTSARTIPGDRTKTTSPDLVRLAIALLGTRSVSEALHVALRVLRHATPRVRWAVLDREAPLLYGVAASEGIGVPEIETLLARVCGPGARIGSGDLMRSRDIRVEPVWHVIPEEAGAARVPDLVLAAWPRRGAAPPASDTLRYAARVVAGAIRSARLLESLLERSSRDPLTGILNRRGIFDVLEKEKARARRHGRPLSVLFVDLDRFKSINDRLGHAAGDEVLVAAAGLLTRLLRSSDSVGRFGGDEFLAVLPDADLSAARRIARRLARVAAATMILTSAGPVTQTLSVGVGSLGEEEPVERLLERADGRMLLQKRRRARTPVFPRAALVQRSAAMAAVEAARQSGGGLPP